MNENTEIYLELADDEHPYAEAAAEDTARLLMEVHRRTQDDSPKSKEVQN